MAVKINTSDPKFPAFIANVTGASSAVQSQGEFVKAVEEICQNVIKDGDKAVIEYTNRFDRVAVKSMSELKVSEAEIDAAYKSSESHVIKALELAAERIASYHKKQIPADIDYVDNIGVRLGNIWKPLKRVGLYVPGGLASYPSSVLMNAIPAKVAGVKELAMVVPAPDGKLNPVVLAAAKVAGITEIYKIGGAQAIAALACGTASINKVDKVVGPGNVYVAAAKKYFSGSVGIDMIAGPSEILVVADNKNNPDWLAADLLSQAEHDSDACSFIITNDSAFADKVIESVEKTLETLQRKDIASASWQKHGVVIVADSKDFEVEAVELIDKIAPEHLELALDDAVANRITAKINNAGAVFLGRYTPEAIGDYIAGPSHVLPTSGNARFSSGLSVYDFLKRVSLIGCTKESFDKLSEATEILANKEGLGAHALSVTVRK